VTTPAPVIAEVLRLDGIEAGYGNTKVLHDVSISVPESAVTALLGPNGAGKTTLLRVASGLLRPSSGRVVLCGEDVTRKETHTRARKGLCDIPEGRGIFPSLTVKENIVLQSVPGEEQSSIETVGALFPALKKRMGQVAGRLSGGEQQMLAISRIYLTNPKVVLLDEVSLGLAPIIVEQIYEALDQLMRSGTAMLIVEQYVSRALALAQKVYLLDRGRVVFAGGPADLEGDVIFHRYLGMGSMQSDESTEGAVSRIGLHKTAGVGNGGGSNP
jgi:branched-chain amino acid transport system ATP-binding protein